MSRIARGKWRPPLALVLGCTLAAVLCLPLIGIVAVRYLFPVMGYQEAVLFVGVIVVIIAAYVGWVLWRILLRPVTALAARADAIRTGEAAGLDPNAHYGTAEMRHLADAMAEMGRVLQDREAVVKSYADHVTHELTSPLTTVQGAVELLDGDLPEAERGRLLTRIAEAVERMRALLAAQRQLAKAADPVAPGQVRLSAVAPAALDVQQDGEVPLPETVMRAVLEQLVSNATAHGAARIWAVVEKDHLRIADDGPGISEGNRARAFDPYFTTRRDQGGTGMGLSIVKRLLESQGATIRLDDGPGAVFVISW